MQPSGLPHLCPCSHLLRALQRQERAGASSPSKTPRLQPHGPARATLAMLALPLSLAGSTTSGGQAWHQPHLGPIILGWPGGVWGSHTAVAEGHASDCASECPHSDQGIAATAGHPHQGAHSEARTPLPSQWPRAQPGARLCRALLLLWHVAAEGLAAMWLWWQQKLRWPQCMLMSGDKTVTAGALHTATGSGDQRHTVHGQWWVSSICLAGPRPLPVSCTL